MGCKWYKDKITDKKKVVKEGLWRSCEKDERKRGIEKEKSTDR